jgi:hypothetical protein
VILYTAAQAWSPAEKKGTLAAFLLATSLLTASGHALGGVTTSVELSYFAVAVIPLLAFTVLGIRVFQSVGLERQRLAVTLLILALGALLAHEAMVPGDKGAGPRPSLLPSTSTSRKPTTAAMAAMSVATSEVRSGLGLDRSRGPTSNAKAHAWLPCQRHGKPCELRHLVVSVTHRSSAQPTRPRAPAPWPVRPGLQGRGPL